MHSNLTRNAYELMEEVFIERHHHPGFEQRIALHELQDTLSRMAYGLADSVYYLSDLDPGVGKSTAISTWIKALLHDGQMREVGVLLCLDRYDEIEQFLRMDLDDRHYAVIVKDGHELDSRGLGKDQADEAQVLITTKEQVRRRTCSRAFSDTEQFFYTGRPRAVRIWDEQFLAGTPLVIPRWNLADLLRPLTHQEDVRDMVKEVIDSPNEHRAGQIYHIPQLPVSLHEWDRLFLDEADGVRQLARSFRLMAGKPVTVRTVKRCGMPTQVLVDAVDEFPEDFKPCLITDASGRIRHTYTLHSMARKDLVRLSSARKAYSKLTCYLVETASGKNAYLGPVFYSLADQVSEIINCKPSEDSLIIHHDMPKSTGRDLPKEVLRRLNDTATDRKVEFLHWGRHTATNAYRDITNTIIVGPLFYNPPGCEGIGRAAARRPTAMGAFSDMERAQVHGGETAHNLFQAACRSAIRKADGDQCPPTHLWVLAPRSAGMKRTIPDIFPGCRIEPWKAPRPSKAVEAAISVLKKASSAGTLEIPFSELQEAAGQRDWYNFNRAVYGTPAFQKAAKELGYAMQGSGRGRRFVRHSLQPLDTVSLSQRPGA